jgi:VWFA-related protein
VRIEEGGESRPVLFFQHVEDPPGGYADAGRRAVASEVSSNQGAPRGHVYVLVFDQWHIRAGNEQKARVAAQRFVTARVKPGDRVALHALPGPGPQVGLSSNVMAAISALPAVRGSLDRQVMGPAGVMSVYEAFQVTRGNEQIAQRVINRALESGTALDVPGRSGGTRAVATLSPESSKALTQVVVDSARNIVATADTESRVFLLALADIVKGLADLDGRKTIILISEGFFTDNLARDVESVAALAAQSYAVIHSLDINTRGIDVGAATPSGGEPASEVQSRLESLGTLAAETDGELVIDANSQGDRPFNRIAAQSQDYYVVGFSPPPEALADRGKYRRISVKVKRAGAQVYARTGYSMREPVTTADRRRAIDAALTAPFPHQALPLRMTTYVLHGTSPGAHRVFMALEAELPLAAGTTPGRADVIFAVKSARDGRVVASGTDTMPLPASAQGGRATATSRFRVQFEAPPGEYLMRAVVREPAGATGSVDRRFVVRAFEGVDLTASDLVVGRSGELPVRAAAYIEDGVSGLLELYARRREDMDGAEVTMELVPVGGSASISSVRADLQDIRATGTGYARRVLAELPLRGIAPGEYVLVARIRAHGEPVIDLSRQVEVVPGSAPAAPAAAAAAARPLTPAVILQGDLVQELVDRLATAAASPAVAAAAERAAAGEWTRLEDALGPPAKVESAPVLTLRGLAFFGLGQYDQAAPALQAALDADPAASRVAFVLGWVHALAGRGAEAVTAWRGAISNDPGMVSAYLALSDTYVRMSHPELAAQVLRQGLKALPASVELASKLAEVERR